MQFTYNDDQITFFDVLKQMTESEDAQFRTAPNWGRFEWSAPLDNLLQENAFYNAAMEETLGPIAATAMIYELSKLPVVVESAASSLLRPWCAPDLPRPVAVIDGEPGQAVRFLPVAKSVLRIRDGHVGAAILSPDDVTETESLYAYPMGRLNEDALAWQRVNVDAEEFMDRWRVATAAEIGGALQGGLNVVLTHVRDRQQFGRPLGSFQGIQHRLANAVTQIEGAQLLTLRAAQHFDPAEVSVALGYVQNVATNIGTDLHQFMGTMGLTLEHPLHRWTYRVRLIRASLGGAAGNLRLTAQRYFGATAAS